MRLLKARVSIACLAMRSFVENARTRYTRSTDSKQLIRRWRSARLYSLSTTWT